MDQEPKTAIETKEVREYNENMPVEILRSEENGRLVLKAFCEAGFNHTEIDIEDLIAYVKKNHPDLL